MLDWLNRHSSNSFKTIVLILPGMLNSSKQNYVTHYVDIAKKMNCITVVKNYRGLRCELLTPRFYCGSNYEDVDQAVQHIKKLYPDHRVFAVGISMGSATGLYFLLVYFIYHGFLKGGVLLCGYLAKFNKDKYISSSMIISSCFDLEITNSELEKNVNSLLNMFITTSLKKHFAKYLIKFFLINQVILK